MLIEQALAVGLRSVGTFNCGKGHVPIIKPHPSIGHISFDQSILETTSEPDSIFRPHQADQAKGWTHLLVVLVPLVSVIRLVAHPAVSPVIPVRPTMIRLLK